MRCSGARRRAYAVLAAAVAAMLLAVPAAATAAPAKTDVVLVFDTTGSMDEAIDDAQEQVRGVMTRLAERLPDVQFALGAVRDYPFEPYGDPGDAPWTVVQSMTGDRDAMQSAVDGLAAGGGGNNPEAYGRAIHEAEVGDGVGWRPGARRVLVMVADDMPHDNDLNEGVPSGFHIESSPYDTGVDPGRDGAVGTGDDLDWQSQLTRLNERGLPMMLVLYQGTTDRLQYWNHWAGLTGGEAVMGDGSDSSALADRLVTLAEKGATKTLLPCPKGGEERGADGICRAQPVVFLPGIMGSELYCGDHKLWAAWRLGTGISHRQLLLAGDGRSPGIPQDPCNVSAGPREGSLVAQGYDVSTRLFGDRFGARFSNFAYDWRKSPGDAIGALERHIDKVSAEHGGVRVRLVAHSMGGLVVRWFLDDAARAAKVSHAVTIGTPYWGSPKSILPLARGEVDPGTPNWLELDSILGNGEVKEMTSNFAGLYSLMPSDAWHRYVGDWLTMKDQDSKKPLKGAGATMAGAAKRWREVNTQLYNEANAAHRALDGFKTNGVRFMAVVGSGDLTIGGLVYDQHLLKDSYDWKYTNGDRTVPLASAAQGSTTAPPLGEEITRRYRCGVAHDKLAGDGDVWEEVASFLDGGTTKKLQDQPCAAQGDEITLRAVPGGKARGSAAGELMVRVFGTGTMMKLSEAQTSGLLQVVERDPDEVVVVVPRGQALGLVAKGRDMTITTRMLSDADAGPPVAYGPSNAALSITTGTGVTVTRSGRPVRSRPADVAAPRTTMRVRRRSRGAVLRFTARDAGRVRATIVKVGGRSAARLTRSTLRVRRLTRKGVLVRYQSVDAFGNVEKVRTRRVRAPKRR